ncbi:MAG: hypothetical protein J6Y13_06530 [Treponema sp.]|nr:hypothetical protein [Treponema sp.]
MLSERKKNLEYLFTFGLPPLLAALCFILIYGVRILNPVYDDWLLAGGDLSQHYIGWEGYRNGNWTFPIGLSDTLTYPTSISVIFTDSIPLPAVFFKLLSPLLPETFQYWGLWGLAGFVLTALVSAILVRKYSPNTACTVLTSLFFTLSPTILQRLYGHESLGGGQWLVIASLLPLAFYREHYHHIRKAAVFWGLLAFLCVGIHIYFAVTCFFSLIAFCLYDLLTTKKLKTAFASGTSYGLTALATTWLLGGLKGGIKGKGAGEVGEFSANLNCLINPLEYSRFFPGLPIHGNGQYEGFAYLGLGIFVLLAVSLILLTTTGGKKAFSRIPYNRQKAIAFAIAAMLSFLFALSPLVTFGSRLLFTIPLPHAVNKLLVTFRSTGRMVWLCYYIIYLTVICLFLSISKRHSPWMQAVILGICLFLQIIDLSPLPLARHSRYAGNRTYENVFSQSPLMRSLADRGDIRHISIVSGMESEELYDVAQFAIEHKMTVNRFWTVHQIGRKDEDELLRANLSEAPADTVFLFKKADEGLCGTYSLEAFSINDRYTIGIPRTAYNEWR